MILRAGTVPVMLDLAMGSFSAVHWLLVIVVILLVFGPSKLSSVGKGLGEGIRNFKKGISGEPDDELDEDDEDEPKQLSAKRGKAARREKLRRKET